MTVSNKLLKAAREWVKRVLKWAATITLILVLAGVTYFLIVLYDDEPVTYAGEEEHFKYGSTGGERGWKNQFGFGIPYWIWVALPEQFPNYLPDQKSGQGYKSFWMIYEKGKDARFDLPIGMSRRRVMGIDRVYFNCAVCHTGSVREDPGADPTIVLGMPANTFELGTLVQFLNKSAKHWKFRSSRLLPRIEEIAAERERAYPDGNNHRPAELNLLDRQIFNYLVVPMMREQLLALLGQLSFIDFSTWGPGRVDTFNPPKALLGFRMKKAPERELLGNSDLPSVWNQKARKGMWLHWDGNNCSVDERNLSAGFGTGATPATLDRDKLLRVADWLWNEVKPPAFPADRINAELAAEGKEVYRDFCWSCHGERQAPFRQAGDGSKVGVVTPIGEIGTDRWRLDSYTPELASAQNSIYAGSPRVGEENCAEYVAEVCNAEQSDEDYRRLRDLCYPARFSHFRKTYGYANMPLDGLWLRAPYLHNGSVRNLRELLEPERRAESFYRGYDVYDYDNVGFVTSGREASEQGWYFDTKARGNSNDGHAGYEYGTLLDEEKKQALIEFLKTF